MLNQANVPPLTDAPTPRSARLQTALAAAAGPTLSFADVLARLDAASTLSATTRRDLKSAVKRIVVNWLGAELQAAPASPAWLRTQTAGWTAARFDVTEGSYNVVWSQLRRALTLSGVVKRPSQRHALGPAWQPLAMALHGYWRAQRAAKDKSPGQNWLAIRLMRFLRWCDAQGLAPDQVDDGVITSFVDHLAATDLRAVIAEKERGLRKAWNHAARHIAGWPKRLVASTRDRTQRPIVAFAASVFPAAFLAELDRYAAERGFLHRDPSPDLGSLTVLERLRRQHKSVVVRTIGATGEQVRRRRLKPLSAPTQRWHRRVLLMTATALVRRGERRIEDIQTIADVVSLEGIGSVLDALAERRQGKAALAYQVNLIETLLSIAARCDLELPDEAFAAIGNLLGELRAQAAPFTDMVTPKNRARIAQFNDPDNFSLLVSCSNWELRTLEAERRRLGRVTPAMARRAEAAIGNVLLCTLPVRLRALVETDWARNFWKPARRGGSATLIYYPDQSKTKRPQQVVLESWKWALLALYHRHYRPHLSGAEGSTRLFPGATATGHKTKGKLANAITGFVRRRTGLVMNVHLYRHLMGAKLLEEHDDLRLVEELLGHAPGSRATRRYVELKTQWAAQRLDRITDGAWPRGQYLHARRDRRPRASA